MAMSSGSLACCRTGLCAHEEGVKRREALSARGRRGNRDEIGAERLLVEDRAIRLGDGRVRAVLSFFRTPWGSPSCSDHRDTPE